VARADAGLPDDAFVYCCFNNSYKITPATFDSWMRVLARVHGSVLWLLQGDPVAAANLRREAQSRGIDGGRLLFARHLPPDEHLARHALADLFLDTLPYNAHTTASDALWAGLPVLTLIGSTFAGRVGASLLTAVGLPDLVASTAAEYEALAVALAGDRRRLASYRERLQRGAAGSRLFDTRRFTKHLESAFALMVERQREGLPPEHFAIAPLAG
jgi:predicted O-linked N-acetylglucosamine transferase (SPINDLY family)